MPQLHPLKIIAVFLLFGFTACTETELLPKPNKQVLVQPNIQYGAALNYRGEEVNLYLDVYQPANNRKNPTLVLLHNSDLMQGSKDDLKVLGTALAEKDITTVAVGYRMGKGGSGVPCDGDAYTIGQVFYRGTQDAHAALRYLAAHSEKLGIDTAQLFAGGMGVGGVAAMSAAFTSQQDFESLFPGIQNDLGPVDRSGNQDPNRFRLRGIIHWGGAWLNTPQMAPASLLPIMGFLDSAETEIPQFKGPYQQCRNYPMLYGSRYIQERLQTGNTTAILHRRIGSNTVTDDSYYFSSNINCFIKDVLSGKQVKGVFTNYVSVCP